MQSLDSKILPQSESKEICERDRSSFANRLFGGLKVLGGASELGVGVTYITASYGTGAALGGGFLVIDGTENLATGIKQVWTGKSQDTISYQALESAFGRGLANTVEAAKTVGFAVMTGGVSNVRTFGTFKKPNLFLVRADKIGALNRLPVREVPLVSPRQVLASKEMTKFIYVLDEAGNVKITFHDPVKIGRQTLERYRHPEILGLDKPIIAAGEISAQNGRIQLINHNSGQFMAYGNEELTERIFTKLFGKGNIDRFEYFGGFRRFNTPMVQPFNWKNWVWPTMSAGVRGADVTSQLFCPDDLSHFADTFIPTAYASSTHQESPLAIRFALNDFIGGRGLLQDPKLFKQATSQMITAALYMQRSPSLFSLDDIATRIKPWQLHHGLQETLVPSLQDPLIQSGIFGDSNDVSNLYLPTYFNDRIETYPADRKRKAKKSIRQIQNAIDHEKPIPEDAVEGLAKLAIEDSVAIETNALSTVANHVNPNKDKKEIESELQKDLDQQATFAQGIGLFNRGLSAVARLTHNKDLRTAATIFPQAINVASNVGSFIGAIGGSGGNPWIAAAGIVVSVLETMVAAQEDDSSKAIMAAFQALFDQMQLLRREMHEMHIEEMQALDQIYQTMHEFYYSLKYGLEIISDRLVLMQEIHAEDEKTKERLLVTIAEKIKNVQEKEIVEKKAAKWAELNQKLAETSSATRVDPSNYGDWFGVVDTAITSNNPTLLTISNPEFIGADLPHDPLERNRYLGHLPVEFLYGALAKLYQEQGHKPKGYSTDLMDYYLSRVLEDKPGIRLSPTLTTADLSPTRFEQQRHISSLAQTVKSFFSIEDVSNPAHTLVIPIIIQANWHLVVIHKQSKHVYIYGSPHQPDWTIQVECVIQQNVPEDFDYIHHLFSNRIAPIYSGAMVVEIVRDLEQPEEGRDEPNEQIISAKKNLEVAREEHVKLFKPTQQLLTSQGDFLKDQSNPFAAYILYSNLKKMYEYRYPQVLPETFNSTFFINVQEVDLLRKLLLAPENAHQLRQELLDENILKEKFKACRDSINAFQKVSEELRDGFEKQTTKLLQPVESAITRYTDERVLQQFKQDFAVGIYGNWFAVIPHRCHLFMMGNSPWCQDRDAELSQASESAKRGFINNQLKQIRSFKDSFLANAKNKASTFRLGSQMDLYHPSSYQLDLVPCLILPEKPSNPVLPNLAFTFDHIPRDMLRAQALGIGYVELRYNIDATDNKFIVKVCFITNNDSPDPCVAAYSIKYKNDDASINFYEGPEAVWWFWVGGTLPQQRDFTRPVKYRDLLTLWGGDIPLPIPDPIPVTSSKRIGAGYSPTSSFNKVDISDQSSHPLLVEIRNRIGNKYLEVRTEHNHKLMSELTGTTGLALVANQYYRAVNDLWLQIELSFLNQIRHPNKNILSLVFNKIVIQDESSLLRHLSTKPTDQYVATTLRSYVAILNLLERLTLSMLPTARHTPDTYLDRFQKRVAATYANFAAYQTEMPSDDELKEWEKAMKADEQREEEETQQFMYDIFTFTLDASPEVREQLRQKKTEIHLGINTAMANRKKAKSENRKAADNGLRSGMLTLPEAIALLKSDLSALPLLPGISTVEPVAIEVSDIRIKDEGVNADEGLEVMDDTEDPEHTGTPALTSKKSLSLSPEVEEDSGSVTADEESSSQKSKENVVHVATSGASPKSGSPWYSPFAIIHALHSAGSYVYHSVGDYLAGGSSTTAPKVSVVEQPQPIVHSPVVVAPEVKATDTAFAQTETVPQLDTASTESFESSSEDRDTTFDTARGLAVQNSTFHQSLSFNEWFIVFDYIHYYARKYSPVTLPRNQVKTLSDEELRDLVKLQRKLKEHQQTYEMQLDGLANRRGFFQDKFDYLERQLNALNSRVSKIMSTKKASSSQISEIKSVESRINDLIHDLARKNKGLKRSRVKERRVARQNDRTDQAEARAAIVHEDLSTGRLTTEFVSSSQAFLMDWNSRATCPSSFNSTTFLNGTTAAQKRENRTVLCLPT